MTRLTPTPTPATVTKGLRAAQLHLRGFRATPPITRAFTRHTHHDAALAKGRDRHKDGQAENSKYDQGQTQPPQTELRREENGKLKVKGKTMAELDAELKAKMEGLAGEGGAAGVEYENGKAEGLKRGVKSNMFRVI
ncbi:hypothetical protein ACRALDRAFT_2056949 [Sodiomyces alcalophilus JCM 7366]|uniref:uncharacterized protein n=1 Tax=Sodiomyces alcalophilus JCM 7366 TaxID=591952 RepID=UPI0039B5BC0C